MITSVKFHHDFQSNKGVTGQKQNFAIGKCHFTGDGYKNVQIYLPLEYDIDKVQQQCHIDIDIHSGVFKRNGQLLL